MSDAGSVMSATSIQSVAMASDYTEPLPGGRSRRATCSPGQFEAGRRSAGLPAVTAQREAASLSDALQSFTGTTSLYSFADSLLLPNDIVATTLRDIQSIYGEGPSAEDEASAIEPGSIRPSDADFEDKFWNLFHAYELPEFKATVRSNGDREKAAFREIIGLPDQLPGQRVQPASQPMITTLSTMPTQWVQDQPQWPCVRGMPAISGGGGLPLAAVSRAKAQPPLLSGVLSPTYSLEYKEYVCVSLLHGPPSDPLSPDPLSPDPLPPRLWSN